MRLAAVSVIRDECDIVESFVRHNAVFFDRLYLLDNSSSDSTLAILQKLSAEGLPLVVVPDDDGYFYQARNILKLLRLALEGERWDFLFPLDGDEFIQASDRRFLEGALANLGDDVLGFSNYIQYIPKMEDDYSEHDVVRRIVHRAEVKPKLIGKVVIPGRLAAHPDFSVTEGNHKALLAGASIPNRRIDQLDLAHFPIRSIEQFVSSVIVSRLAWLARTDYHPRWSQHVRAFYDDLKMNPQPTLAALTEAMDHYIEPYSEDGPPQSVTIIHAPFEAAYERLQYADLIDVKTLPRIMNMAEGLIDKLHQARANSMVAVPTAVRSIASVSCNSGLTDPDLGPCAVIGHWNDVSTWRAVSVRAEPTVDIAANAETTVIRLVEDEQDTARNAQIEIKLKRNRLVKIITEVKFESVERQVVLLLMAGTDRFSCKVDPRTKLTSEFARGGGVVSTCRATQSRDGWWRIEMVGYLSAQAPEGPEFIAIAITKFGFHENYIGDGKSAVAVGSVTAIQALVDHRE